MRDEMLQNLLYFWNTKTLINALVYVDIDQGIHQVKKKLAQKELCGCSYSKSMTNFEVFHWRNNEHFIKHKPRISEECSWSSFSSDLTL